MKDNSINILDKHNKILTSNVILLRSFTPNQGQINTKWGFGLKFFCKKVLGFFQIKWAVLSK